MRFSVLVATVAGAAAAVVQQPVSIDDSDPAVIYEPPTAWRYNRNMSADYQLYQNSDTQSTIQGATITWKFNGTYVEYWSNTSPYDGPCEVAVDGGNKETIFRTAESSSDVPIRLYLCDNLSPTIEHTIVITVAGNTSFCKIDRFVYIPVLDNTTPAGGSSTPWGAIGGAIGGGLCLILVVAVLYWWCCRPKQSHDIEKPNAQPSSTPNPLPSEPPAYSDKTTASPSSSPMTLRDEQQVASPINVTPILPPEAIASGAPVSTYESADMPPRRHMRSLSLRRLRTPRRETGGGPPSSIPPLPERSPTVDSAPDVRDWTR